MTDGLNRLLQRAVFQIGKHLRLHGQDPAILRAGGYVIFRQAITYNAAHRRGRIQRNALNDNFFRLVIQLADIGIIDLGFLQLVFQQFSGVVRLCANSVIHHHLKNQVGSALQIQAQMDAVQ